MRKSKQSHAGQIREPTTTNMKNLFLLIVFVTSIGDISAQKYVSEKTFVSFFSDAAIEDITADNRKSSSIFDASSGEIVFSIPIRDFRFAKSLMREHFNEKYMESDKYPKATFKGKISGFDNAASGEQNARAIGEITIHGVTQKIEIPGTIIKNGNKLSMKSKFIIKLADFKIEIPQLLWQNIAEQVEVTVDFAYRPQ
jgi:hypothetical protein